MKSIQYRENVGMALQTLMAHKFRSFLTVLGIIIGVVTVIVIASILTGLRQNVITFVEEYGTENIFAFHLNTGPQFGRRPRDEWLRKPLTVEDARAIREQCPSVRDVTWEGFPWETRVKVRHQNNILRNFQFRGVPANYASITNLRPAEGRFFSEVENQHRMKVCTLGADARKTLFPNSDPIGKTIQINGIPFIVVGTMGKRKGGFMGETSRITPSTFRTSPFTRCCPGKTNTFF